MSESLDRPHEPPTTQSGNEVDATDPDAWMQADSDLWVNTAVIQECRIDFMEEHGIAVNLGRFVDGDGEAEDVGE